jgi:acetyl/propionyl-CoA carboxylase alpha subunit
MEVSVHYDPLIAKLIVHGQDRREAIERLRRAIGEYKIEGVKNTLFFGLQVIEHPQFVEGVFDTSFISRYINDQMPEEDVDHDIAAASAILAANLFAECEATKNPVIQSTNKSSNWKDRAWR